MGASTHLTQYQPPYMPHYFSDGLGPQYVLFFQKKPKNQTGRLKENMRLRRRNRRFLAVYQVSPQTPAAQLVSQVVLKHNALSLFFCIRLQGADRIIRLRMRGGSCVRTKLRKTEVSAVRPSEKAFQPFLQ
ncbi:hypothetical protein [Neisseria chenwenguii]|uniref:hypothetical protein n=1 Tax=Neisseria chenwenguii TaxID=1853278 RepID=UPI0012FE0CF3|nr:hypothetical protein [Neisseria chenwenguii]